MNINKDEISFSTTELPNMKIFMGIDNEWETKINLYNFVIKCEKCQKTFGMWGEGKGQQSIGDIFYKAIKHACNVARG